MSANSIVFKADERVFFTKAYPPQLQQVFVNVLRNAVEAIREAGRERGLITIRYDALPQDKLAIRIQDNGFGIPEEDISKLGKFYSTRRSKKPNSGIGLYVSQRILGFHEGHFEWNSTLHQGTEVSIVIPSPLYS
jgi:signal transduction histidine kinase